MELREIVVPIDFSLHSDAATTRASVLAAHYRARLLLVHAIPPRPEPPIQSGQAPLSTDPVETDAIGRLQQLASNLESEGLVASHVVSRLAPAEAIGDVAGRCDYPLIVMGTHGRSGVNRAFLGSVAERTLRTAPCPVLTVREAPESAGRSIRRILVGTDFSLDAEHATDVAVSLGEDLGAEVHVVYVLRMKQPTTAELMLPESYFIEDARKVATRRLEAVGERIRNSRVECSVELLEGEPSTSIADLVQARGMDLVVVGTRGHSGLKHVVLGSVAERVLRLSSCSVLTTKLTDRDGAGNRAR